MKILTEAEIVETKKRFVRTPQVEEIIASHEALCRQNMFYSANLTLSDERNVQLDNNCEELRRQLQEAQGLMVISEEKVGIVLKQARNEHVFCPVPFYEVCPVSNIPHRNRPAEEYCAKCWQEYLDAVAAKRVENHNNLCQICGSDEGASCHCDRGVNGAGG